MDERRFTAKRAYEAACELVEIVSKRLHSDNLTMLLSIMALKPFGDSSDPALLHEWKRCWGSAPERSEREALDIISRFIAKEGVWDPDDRAPQLVRDGVQKFLLEGDTSDPVFRDWKTAVWREGNRYKKPD